MPDDRHVPLEGASNFRDFGGYATRDGRQVKWRRLYRSDRLSELTDADHQRLAPHAIRYVFDLRRASEANLSPTRWHGPGAPELIRSPLFEDEAGPNTFERIAADPAARRDAELARAIMGEMYVRLVTEPGPLAAFGRMFARLAEPEAFPALFHCSAGKDRTGVTSALILLVLGVAREDVVADFMLTQRYYDSDANRAARIAQIVATTGLGFWSEEALVPIFSVEPKYLEMALRRIEAEGGAEAFLTTKAAVPPETFERMREALLE